MRLLGRYVSDKNGNVAITFALIVTVLLLIMGVALDYARAVRAKWTLQAATDAAVIMIANSQKSDAESRTLAQTMLNTNAHFQVTIKSLELPAANAVNKTSKLTSTYTLPTVLMGIFGVPTMTVDGYAAATRSVQKLDVVMVLDNSGSMTQDNRIDALKAAATSAVDSLIANNTNVRVGIVPFSLFVNVGPQYKTAPWIDDTVAWQHLKSDKRKNATFSSVRRFDLFAALGLTWAGCVEARTGGYDVTDDAPDTAAKKYVPSFAPDDPGALPTIMPSLPFLFDPPNSASWWLNNYVGDTGDCATAPSGTDYAAQQDRTCKYYTSSVNSLYRSPALPTVVMSPNQMCTTKPLTRLTSDAAAIKSAINAMVPSGSTNIAEGTAWGFRLLSDQQPFADGMTAADRAKGGRRVMIVMTDGENEILALNNVNGSTYSPYGYKNDTGNRLPGLSTAVATPGQNIGKAPIDARLSLVCQNARAGDIEIYSIGVSVGATGTQPLLDCASKPGNAFFIDSSTALNGVFEKIVGNISVPYLSN